MALQRAVNSRRSVDLISFMGWPRFAQVQRLCFLACAGASHLSRARCRSGLRSSDAAGIQGGRCARWGKEFSTNSHYIWGLPPLQGTTGSVSSGPSRIAVFALWAHREATAASFKREPSPLSRTCIDIVRDRARQRLLSRPNRCQARSRPSSSQRVTQLP